MFVATRWDCPRCATQDIQEDICPNCGWYRNGATGENTSMPVLPVVETFQPAPGDNVFVLHKGNTGFVMGRSRRTGFHYTVWFLLMMFVTTATIALSVSYLVGEWNTISLLEQSGVSVQATVINHRTVSGKSTSYYLTYQFTVKGHAYEREQTIGRNTYDRYPIEAKVSVSYLASNPTISRLAGDSADNSDLVNTTVFLTLLCLGMFIGAAYLGVKSLRYGRMSREGQLLRGRVAACTGMRGYKGRWDVALSYSFQTPDGQAIYKTQKATRNDLYKKSLPRPGTPVAVLYVDDNLFEVM